MAAHIFGGREQCPSSVYPVNRLRENPGPAFKLADRSRICLRSIRAANADAQGRRIAYFPRIPDLLFWVRVLWRLRGETMKNRGSWRGTLVVVFAIGAGWIGYMGWPLYGLITLAAEQSNSPNRPQARAVVQDPNCPGNDNHALMCRLVNEYRAKHGLKPVQLDDAVTREAQYFGLTN